MFSFPRLAEKNLILIPIPVSLCKEWIHSLTQHDECANSCMIGAGFLYKQYIVMLTL